MDEIVTIEFEIIADFVVFECPINTVKLQKLNVVRFKWFIRVNEYNCCSAQLAGFLGFCIAVTRALFFPFSIHRIQIKGNLPDKLYSSIQCQSIPIHILGCCCFFSFYFLRRASRFSSEIPFIYICVELCLLWILLVFRLFLCFLTVVSYNLYGVFFDVLKWKSIDLNLGEVEFGMFIQVRQ